MSETWYVLEDGTVADPSECAFDKNGKLAHKNGLVQIRDDGETPRSRSVDPDAERAKKPAPTKIKEATSPHNREMKADDSGPKYKTR